MRLLCPTIVMMTLAAAPGSAAGPTGEAKLQAMIAGRTAGPERSCIPERPDTRSVTIDGVGLVYDVGPTRYVTRFEGGCSQLDWRTIVVTRTPTSQLCRGDIADIVTRDSPPIPISSCVFGPFTPYRRAK